MDTVEKDQLDAGAQFVLKSRGKNPCLHFLLFPLLSSSSLIQIEFYFPLAIEVEHLMHILRLRYENRMAEYAK